MARKILHPDLPNPLRPAERRRCVIAIIRTMMPAGACNANAARARLGCQPVTPAISRRALTATVSGVSPGA